MDNLDVTLKKPIINDSIAMVRNFYDTLYAAYDKGEEAVDKVYYFLTRGVQKNC